jgi:hypothetical protein
MYKNLSTLFLLALAAALATNMMTSMTGSASAAGSSANEIQAQAEVQRVGFVVAYIPDQSITIVDRDGNPFTFELASPLKIVPDFRASMLAPGAFVTIISPNNIPGGKQIAEGIVVHPGVPTSFPIPTFTFTPFPSQKMTPTATPFGATPSLTETTPTGTAFGSTPSPVKTSTAATTATKTAVNTPAPSGDPVLVGAGDISSCSQNNDEATAKLLDNIPGTVFTAGDNAYPDGTYDQYVNCYGPTWGRHKSRTQPAPGNHDYHTSNAAGYFQYFNNPPAYYAYNLGSWRIYALNSEIDVSASGSQGTWLQNDLAAHPSQCVLAYWHKPRWSSSSVHGSISSVQPLWQILYNAKAELVINGHDHDYERFAEMNASGSAVSPGLREIVAGTGGESHYSFATILSASQVHNSSTFGVLKLTLHSTSYDWKFVPIAGQSFTDSGTTNCH